MRAPGDGAARNPAREQAAAKERTLQRAVAVDPAPPEARHLAGCVEPWDRIAVVAEDACLEVGLEPAEGLARQDRQPHADQRTGRGVEDPVRRGDAAEAVGQVAPSPVD